MKTPPIRWIGACIVTFGALFSPVRVAAATAEQEREFGEIVLLQPVRHTWAQVTSDTEYIYTSNELLLPDTELLPAQEDGIFHESLGLRVTPPALGHLNTALFLRQEFLRYAKHAEYDFDAQTAGVQFSCPVTNWFTVYGGGSAQRLYLSGNQREFFKAYDGQLGLWRRQQLSQYFALFGGYQCDWRPSTPGSYTRIDHTPFAGVIATLLPNLSVQLQYRCSVREYHDQGRLDLNQLVNLDLTYSLNSCVALAAFTRYSYNDSNRTARDYELFEGGVGLKLAVAF
jgi:hypothetical protein